MLRPLRAEDFVSLDRIASDPGLWEQHPASDRYQEPGVREFVAERLCVGLLCS